MVKAQKKPFFRRRKVSEIKKLDISSFSTRNGLVERITGLEPDHALELRVSLTPGEFFRGNKNGSRAGRLAGKYGSLVEIGEPEPGELPKQTIAGNLAQLSHIPEQDVKHIGYSFAPLSDTGLWEITKDERPRIVRFSSLLEASKLLSYSEQLIESPQFEERGRRAAGIFPTVYEDAKRVNAQGASALVLVPSRTSNVGRYKVQLDHLPVRENEFANSIIWSLRAEYRGERTGDSPGNLRFGSLNEVESPGALEMHPHFIAAYWGTANYYGFDEEGPKSSVLMRMNPFALPSRALVAFYKKLKNNVVIFDRTLNKNSNGRQLRWLHQDEIDRAIGMYIATQGTEASIRTPKRDKSLKDYDWEIPQAA